MGPQPYPVIYVVANPVRGHKEVATSTGHIMVTTRYSDQQGSKSRQTFMRLYKRWHRLSNKTVHQTSFTPYREQPRLTRIVVAYPRPAFSATNQTNTFQPFWSTIPSFSRLHIAQKQGKLKYRGPWWWMPWAGEAGVRASIQPSKALCIFEKAPQILPVRRSMWPSYEEKWPWSEISFSLRNLPVRAFDSRVQGISPPLARQRSSCPPPSPNLVRTHLIENYQALRDSGPCLFTNIGAASAWSSVRTGNRTYAVPTRWSFLVLCTLTNQKNIALRRGDTKMVFWLVNVHIVLYTRAQIDAPAGLEADYARN